MKEMDYRLIKMSRPQAVRKKCLDCMAGQRAEVRKCRIYSCPLWPYRLGKKVKNNAYNSSLEKEKPKTRYCDLCKSLMEFSPHTNTWLCTGYKCARLIHERPMEKQM